MDRQQVVEEFVPWLAEALANMQRFVEGLRADGAFAERERIKAWALGRQELHKSNVALALLRDLLAFLESGS